MSYYILMIENNIQKQRSRFCNYLTQEQNIINLCICLFDNLVVKSNFNWIFGLSKASFVFIVFHCTFFNPADMFNVFYSILAFFIQQILFLRILKELLKVTLLFTLNSPRTSPPSCQTQRRALLHQITITTFSHFV